MVFFAFESGNHRAAPRRISLMLMLSMPRYRGVGWTYRTGCNAVTMPMIVS